MLHNKLYRVKYLVWYLPLDSLAHQCFNEFIHLQIITTVILTNLMVAVTFEVNLK